MRYTVTIKDDETGEELFRRYEWEVDGDFTGKGEHIEDMLKVIETKAEAWSAMEPEHQVPPDKRNH